jgi:hypothetical protein
MNYQTETDDTLKVVWRYISHGVHRVTSVLKDNKNNTHIASR